MHHEVVGRVGSPRPSKTVKSDFVHKRIQNIQAIECKVALWVERGIALNREPSR